MQTDQYAFFFLSAMRGSYQYELGSSFFNETKEQLISLD
ncbi:hypothetical protein C2W63_02958 [Bacillus velezensis]|nr:hypothetical protein C2W63_02958 [Bacillus velezensis]